MEKRNRVERNRARLAAVVAGLETAALDADLPFAEPAFGLG